MYTKHVLNTWLLANLFHPLLFSLGCLVFYNNAESFMLFGSLIAGLVFSLPALLLCIIFLPALIYSPGSLLEKICIWCLAVAGGIIITAMALCLIFIDIDFFLSSWLYFLPGVLSAVLSIIIRITQFQNLARAIASQNKISNDQNTYHEHNI